MDRDDLIDLFAPFGPVTVRRMFSGHGVSVDGVTFALALRSGLYLRADESTIARFEAEGCGPFQYEARGKTVVVRSYWQMPARLFDEPDDVAEWARAALVAAERAALAKRAKAPKRKAKKTPVKPPVKKAAKTKTTRPAKTRGRL